MKQTVTEPFEELVIPRREMQSSFATLYRVYSDSKSFELVEAVSAFDAFANSKIKNIYKIKRHDPLEENVINLKQMSCNITEELASLKQETITPVTDPEIKPVAEVIAEYTEPSALNHDEVERLLNG